MSGALADVIAPNLKVLFCGINPGLTAATAGHNFAGRSNRFWRAIHLAGFTPQQLAPEDERMLLQFGCGVTAVVERATAGAGDLTRQDYAAAAAAFGRKIARNAPGHVAFLGKPAWSALSGQRRIAWGPQPGAFEGSRVWVLPNPSGRNLAFTLDQLVAAYRDLYAAAFADGEGP
ncbi:G/U mismatch-specific DNA glycosylase [Caulobacter sp. KR2-114]|uniref:G/U mismatch-specific DNA glycosylase n=1 Tax=Caulobacter sp. KR2-114 TaxID=3400912 RepID=UPI003BFB91D4